MLNIFSKIFGSSNDRTIKRMQHLVDQINDLSDEMNKHDDAFFLNLRKTLNSQFKESNNDINSIIRYIDKNLKQEKIIISSLTRSEIIKQKSIIISNKNDII